MAPLPHGAADDRLRPVRRKPRQLVLTHGPMRAVEDIKSLQQLGLVAERKVRL
jgi:hypothetical protein